ncbi:hypothetical protein KR032_002883 [Drosophila birchii]|nr:hypothetical protein KR032_002883 [Drosophila birchii]
MRTESNEKWIVCRVCLNGDSEEMLHEIFSQTASTRLDQMLHICAGVPVSLDDNFPDKMCSKCMRCLRLSYKFRLTCQRSHQHVMDMLAREARNANLPGGDADNQNLSDDFTSENVFKVWEEDTSQLDGGLKDEELQTEEEAQQEPETQEMITYVVEGAEGEETIIYDGGSEAEHTEVVFDGVQTGIEETEAYAEYEEFEELIPVDNASPLPSTPADQETRTRSTTGKIRSDQLPDNDMTEFVLSSDESESVLAEEKPKSKMSVTRQRSGKKPAHGNRSATDGDSLDRKLGRKPRDKHSTYICDVCGNIYPTQARLTEHMKFHSGVKPHECEICGRGFVQNQQLVRHMNTHTGNRPYKCNYCPAAFADRSTKTKHHRIHTKERPYECDVCSRTFTYSDNLKFHKMIHTGEKPHVCDLCGKGFVKAYKMRLHRVTHERRGQWKSTSDVEMKNTTEKASGGDMNTEDEFVKEEITEFLNS